MAKARVFISIDYDQDSDLRAMLAGRAKNSDTPFEIADWSVKEELSGDWKKKIRERIKKMQQMAVICGEYTDKATGVSTEVGIAQDESIPYFLLWVRSDRQVKRSSAARSGDKIYRRTWDNLKDLIAGKR
jgi:hypothetical protein